MCIGFDIHGHYSMIFCACVVQPLEVDDRPKILCEFVTQVYSAFILFAFYVLLEHMGSPFFHISTVFKQ